MNEAKMDKYLKTNPYYKYDKDRTDELMKSFVSKFKSNDRLAWLRFVAIICQSLAVDESNIMQNQAVLNDPTPYKDGSRDKLLRMFGKMFINDTIAKNNKTYKHFDKGYMNVKGGDNK